MRATWLLYLAVSVATNLAPARAASIVTVERFYPNGQIERRETYTHGKKVGLHQSWWPSGTLRRSATYWDDALQGEFRTWREDGHPYELRHFTRGHEDGVQQSWNEDGTLFLNYVVRNGRRYGFVNAAPCLPTDANGMPVRGTS